MCDKDNTKNLTSINTICSALEFSGSNLIDFLNNLVISDLFSIEKGRFHYTAVCNPKGRIISSLWINLISDEKVELVCPKNLLEEIETFFNMRKFRLKIIIQSSEKFITINQKNNSIELITKDNGFEKQSKSTETEFFYQFIFAQGLPWIDAINTEKFIPQHVNLDQKENIMSFTKGCYPGQEIIARIKYLGKIKKRMQQVEHVTKETLENNVKDLELVSPIVYFESTKQFSVQVLKS